MTAVRLSALSAAVVCALLLVSCGSFFISDSTVTQITLSPTNPSIQVGDTTNFTATGTRADGRTMDVTPGATWTSTHPEIATISSTGVATGVSVGTTRIDCKYQEGDASTFVTVTNGTLVSIKVTPANQSITIGQTLNMAATATYSDGTTRDITASVTWTSNTPSIATITQSGLATGVARGSTTITATSGGTSGSTVLTVN